jgi:beta-galactosidase GanA
VQQTGYFDPNGSNEAMTSNKTASSFPYGASYYPLVYAEETWEPDLQRMAETGITVLRTNDIHGAWDRLEPQKGHICLDVLERFYRLAGKHGIHILLSTGAASPPLWLARLYPDVRIISSRGEPYPLGGTYHWYCIHHPGYREEQERFLDVLAAWAVAQPEHFGWQISNELGFPFLPTRESGVSPYSFGEARCSGPLAREQMDKPFRQTKCRLDLYCYCATCQGRFRQWLRRRYGSLEALTEAWTWSATTHVYNEWEDVTPPEMLPTAWSSVTRWIDWRLFWQDSFAEFARWQHELIRRHDSDHPTVVNTFNFHVNDRFGTFMGLDQWKIAQAVDHIGYDLYPGLKVEGSSMFLDHGRSVSRSVGRDFWVPEMESGPLGGWVLGPVHNTTPQDIKRYVFESLGHDAKAIVYMPWKEWDYQPIHWGALVDLDGQPTQRMEAAAQMGRYIHANAEFLLEAHVPQGDVALLESKPNAILFAGLQEEETLFAAQRGAYLSFWELGNAVDFITPPMLHRDDVHGYGAVCLPLMAALDLDTAQGLHEFVVAGGLVVGFARCGMLNERGWYNHRLPIPGLREVFGLRVGEVEPAGTTRVRFEGRGFPVHLQVESIEPDPDTEVLAYLADGRPAVTLHRLGQGRGLYFATQADSAYFACDNSLLKEVLRVVLGCLNIKPTVRFCYGGAERREVDPHLLVGKGRALVLITNYLHTHVEGVLTIRQDHPVTAVQCGLEKKRPLSYVQDGDEVRILLEIERDEVVKAVDIHWDEDTSHR